MTNTLTQPAMPHPVIELVKAPAYAMFRNSMPDANIVFPDGQKAAFLGGRFVTDNQNFITILDNEILRGHPSLRRGTPEESIGYGDDPIAGLRAKIIEDYKTDQARIAAELTNGKDFGTSNQGPVKAQSSRDIAVTAAAGFSKA